MSEEEEVYEHIKSVYPDTFNELEQCIKDGMPLAYVSNKINNVDMPDEILCLIIDALEWKYDQINNQQRGMVDENES